MNKNCFVCLAIDLGYFQKIRNKSNVFVVEVLLDVAVDVLGWKKVKN